MSDLPPDPSFDLARPAPRTWRDRLAATAESLDLTPGRLAIGVLAVAVAGVLAWRALAPPAPPAEMELPFAPSAAPAGGATGTSAPPGDGGDGPAGAEAAPTAGTGAGPAVGSAPGSGTTQPSEVVVHVAGAVGTPGVQRLPAGARVVDAVDAAGGAVPGADLGRINLAVPVEDGQQVYVPRLGETPPTPAGGPAAAGGGSGGGSGSGGGTDPAEGAPVNVNSATVEQLEVLPGVGPATAEAIIAYREANGPFTSVDQLLDVRGIGEAKLEQMRDRVAL